LCQKKLGQWALLRSAGMGHVDLSRQTHASFYSQGHRQLLRFDSILIAAGWGGMGKGQAASAASDEHAQVRWQLLA